MINTLDIYDYKCLHTAELLLGKLNLITGKSSSGKSSVIQALKLLVDNLENKSSTKQYWCNGFSQLIKYFQNQTQRPDKSNGIVTQLRFQLAF